MWIGMNKILNFWKNEALWQQLMWLHYFLLNSSYWHKLYRELGKHMFVFYVNKRMTQINLTDCYFLVSDNKHFHSKFS